MPTLAEKIIDYAESQVGVTEVPMGSNRGPRVEDYQDSTTLAGTGWPWCAAFVCHTWQQAGVPIALTRTIASPSTYYMCKVAREKGLVCSPRAGAAIVWCSEHVEILHSKIDSDTWRTIGGNTGDAVRFRIRDLGGSLIYGPPGLSDVVIPDKPVFQTIYWLEDLHADYDVLGPWKLSTPKLSLAAARKRKAELPDDREAEAKVLRSGDGGFVVRVGQPRQYGGFRGIKAQERRKAAEAILEKRLGRQLRPWSERVRIAPEERAEALGKVD